MKKPPQCLAPMASDLRRLLAGSAQAALISSQLALALPSLPVRADIAAKGGARSLGTLVNGTRDGRCTAGVCVVSGGTKAGNNRFHRLSQFDTRGPITAVRFQNQRDQTVIVGVTNPAGSWIDKTVAFSKPGNLLLLSPGGIHLGPGTSFLQINQLGLSTATRLAMQGDQRFDVFNTTALDAAGLSSNPRLDAQSLQADAKARRDAGISSVPAIVADGIDIRIERELLLDAVDGSVQLHNSKLTAQSQQGEAGSITLSGQTIELRGSSQLQAQGAKAGGLIQIGGSWQNSNPAIRQALTTTIEPTVVVDASATDSGNGGTIVAWSDIHQPASHTTALGHFSANGGPAGGDGGRIETSGHHLDVNGIQISTTAPQGNTGLWLLDPTDIIITNGTGSLFGTQGSPITYQDTTVAKIGRAHV